MTDKRCEENKREEVVHRDAFGYKIYNTIIINIKNTIVNTVTPVSPTKYDKDELGTYIINKAHNEHTHIKRLRMIQVEVPVLHDK